MNRIKYINRVMYVWKFRINVQLWTMLECDNSTNSFSRLRTVLFITHTVLFITHTVLFITHTVLFITHTVLFIKHALLGTIWIRYNLRITRLVQVESSSRGLGPRSVITWRCQGPSSLPYKRWEMHPFPTRRLLQLALCSALSLQGPVVLER